MKRGIYKSTRCPYRVRVVSSMLLTPDKNYVKVKLAMINKDNMPLEKYKWYKILKANIYHWVLL